MRRIPASSSRLSPVGLLKLDGSVRVALASQWLSHCNPRMSSLSGVSSPTSVCKLFTTMSIPIIISRFFRGWPCYQPLFYARGYSTGSFIWLTIFLRGNANIPCYSLLKTSTIMVTMIRLHSMLIQRTPNSSRKPRRKPLLDLKNSHGLTKMPSSTT